MTIFDIFHVFALFLLLTPVKSESKRRYINCRGKSGKWGRCIMKGSPCPGVTHSNRVCNSAALCCMPHTEKSWEKLSTPLLGDEGKQ